MNLYEKQLGISTILYGAISIILCIVGIYHLEIFLYIIKLLNDLLGDISDYTYCVLGAFIYITIYLLKIIGVYAIIITVYALDLLNGKINYSYTKYIFLTLIFILQLCCILNDIILL